MVLGQQKAVLAGSRWNWVSIGRYWLVLGGNGLVWGRTGCFLVVMGQCRVVLVDIWWYWVSIGLLCLYLLKKKMEIWWDVTIAGRTDEQKGKIGLLSQWTMEGWDEQWMLANNQMSLTWMILWRKSQLHPESASNTKIDGFEILRWHILVIVLNF